MASDPGPIARLQAIVANPDTMSVIAQRITDADNPETLREIAKSWQIPLGRLAEWITEDRERAEQYAAALRIASEQSALEALRIADAVQPEAGAVQKAKLQVDTRLKLASKLNRERFGDAVEHKHTGSVSLIAVLSSLPRGGREIDVTPGAATGSLPPPMVEHETSLQKIPQKTEKLDALI